MVKKIIVKGDADKIAYFSWHLKKLGLFQEMETRFVGSFETIEEIYNVIYFCMRNDLRYIYKSEENDDYRTTFFENNAPNKKGKYRCVYCGKLLDADRVHVDYIYPLSRVVTNPELIEKLISIGAREVNSTENLVPACETCIKVRKERLGNWPKKALKGQKNSYWDWMWRRFFNFLYTYDLIILTCLTIIFVAIILTL